MRGQSRLESCCHKVQGVISQGTSWPLPASNFSCYSNEPEKNPKGVCDRICLRPLTRDTSALSPRLCASRDEHGARVLCSGGAAQAGTAAATDGVIRGKPPKPGDRMPGHAMSGCTGRGDSVHKDPLLPGRCSALSSRPPARSCFPLPGPSPAQNPRWRRMGVCGFWVPPWGGGERW